MTPDSIGLFVSYLMQKFMADYDQYSLLDPAVGTGNLLTTILNQQSDQNIHATGIDVDDLLIKLAYAGANLLKHPIQFYNQDALEPLLLIWQMQWCAICLSAIIQMTIKPKIIG